VGVDNGDETVLVDGELITLLKSLIEPVNVAAVAVADVAAAAVVPVATATKPPPRSSC